MKSKKNKPEKYRYSPEFHRLRRRYFLASLFCYLGFFLCAFMVASVFLTILQVHPYIYLAVSIILLLADILFTDRVINTVMKEHWTLS